MKKYSKILLVLSLLLNIIFLVYTSLPQYFSLGVNHDISDFNHFQSGGYVKSLNFKWVSSEFYIIFTWKTEYLEDWTEATDYYYINWLQPDWGIAYTWLKPLEVDSVDESKIVLFDDMYTFEVYKTGRVLWKDKNGEMFELINIIKF